MNQLRVITTITPDGEFHLIIDEKDTVRASGFGTIKNLAHRLPKDLQDLPLQSLQSHPHQQLIQEYYRGDPYALNKIPHHQEGSDLQQKVWTAISGISYGKTSSYKELAEKAGHPAAVRAVGTICGLNRLILLVPCHRVVKSDGSIGSYLYGPAIKESLLRHEGAIV